MAGKILRETWPCEWFLEVWSRGEDTKRVKRIIRHPETNNDKKWIKIP